MSRCGEGKALDAGRNPRGPGRSGGCDDDKQQVALAALETLYGRVDAQLSELSCRACGDCCDFGRFGHRLFISALEAMWMVRAAPPQLHVSPEACPYCVDRRCTNREGRALGCRTYFCNDPDGAVREALHERAITRVKDICDACGVSWRYLPVGEALLRLNGRDT